jgi:hypothetical protein
MTVQTDVNEPAQIEWNGVSYILQDCDQLTLEKLETEIRNSLFEMSARRQRHGWVGGEEAFKKEYGDTFARLVILQRFHLANNSTSRRKDRP